MLKVTKERVMDFSAGGRQHKAHLRTGEGQKVEEVMVEAQGAAGSWARGEGPWKHLSASVDMTWK